MTASPGETLRRQLRHEINAFRGKWVWLLALGIILVAFGTVAIASPFIPGLSVVIALGVILMLSGISQAIGAFWSREWSGFFFCLLAGIFYLVTGFIFVRKPGAAQVALTLVIATFLMVGGIFKIVAALCYRFEQWGWVAASGAIALILGFMIVSDWPESSLWVIGTFLGIEMIFHGWAEIMLALALRRLPKLPT